MPHSETVEPSNQHRGDKTLHPQGQVWWLWSNAWPHSTYWRKKETSSDGTKIPATSTDWITINSSLLAWQRKHTVWELQPNKVCSTDTITWTYFGPTGLVLFYSIHLLKHMVLFSLGIIYSNASYAILLVFYFFMLINNVFSCRYCSLSS